jgi:hypothetical protein
MNFASPGFVELNKLANFDRIIVLLIASEKVTFLAMQEDRARKRNYMPDTILATERPHSHAAQM